MLATWVKTHIKYLLQLLSVHWLSYLQYDLIYSTVKPVLSRHRIKQTVAEGPKFISLIYFKWNLY